LTSDCTTVYVGRAVSGDRYRGEN